MRFAKGLSFAALAALACSSRPQPAGEATPSANPVSGSSVLRASEVVLPSPQAPALCTLGKGDPNAHCDQGGAAEFWAEVDAAIDEVVAKRPTLFNLDRVIGRNGYYVLAHDAFYLGVAEVLQAKGLCAQYDYRVLHVKDSQDRSEEYDLVLPNGHIRRAPIANAATCAPASFPLDPADVIDRVRVAFYSIQCEDGRTPPRNGEGLLPSECTGYVTATPKKDDDSDVHKAIHGPEILWELELGENQVVVHDFPNVPFNKFVGGRDVGPFRLCATVQTVRGCLEGEVIP